MAPAAPHLDIANLAGTHLGGGKYLLEERIGAGSMGQVYRAKHLELQRTVAIKILKPSILQRPKAAERFRREARAASMLQHRNTVQLLDFGREGNLLYIVMEFLDGSSLDKLLDERKTLNLHEIIDIMSQICAAISAAHDQGILHRDIKPENIILIPGIDDDGRQCLVAKVCDFGIAKIVGRDQPELTGVHEVWGTPNAMSPEQAQGLPLDQRSDVYSLGILLYQMATGRVPFTGRTPVEIMGRHVKEPPTPPTEIDASINKDLEAVILKALAKDPAQRQPTARGLRAELRDILQLGNTMSELIPIVELSPDDGVEEDATVVQPGGFGFSAEALRASAARNTGKPAFDEPETPRDLEAPPPSSPQAHRTDRNAKAQHATGRTVKKNQSQRLLLIAIGVVSLLLVAGIVAILLTGGDENLGVDIASEPTGATVRVNGEEVGTTPLHLEVGPQATITINKRGYAQWTGTGGDLKGGTVDVALERTLDLGDVVVDSDPVGANVIVDGKLHSTDTPTVVTGLWVGTEHQVVVTKTGHEPVLERVSFATEDLVRLAVTLRTSDSAYVYGWCEESGCDVRVDGKVLGNTSIGPIEVPADTAQVVELLNKGARIVVREVLLEPGKTLLLEPDPS